MNNVKEKGSSSAIYGLGFVGAAIYFIGVANNFGEGVLGLLKALVWPAYLVYDLFKLLAA
jgi:hypothetical protein